ncbi:MAG TPA: DUF2071 domain-containing protein [Anaerolineales bacterium]|nr:DUF2071 domain-containing protein [Anaerolineales bacterium]
MFKSLLHHTQHRPYPLPSAPWVMQQVWHDLLFAHWRIDIAQMRAHVPAILPLDTFDNSAWISVVPFRMSGIHPRYTFDVPGLSAFPELNVRTYVSHRGRPGVFFFSLEAANAMAVQIARAWFHLPYFHAKMSLQEQNGLITYQSERIHKNAPPASFSGTYRPLGVPVPAPHGSLTHWLTERYCLYTLDSQGRLLRGEIHHQPWPIETVEVHIASNSMTEAAGIRLPAEAPLVQFSRHLEVLVWSLVLAEQD